MNVNPVPFATVPFATVPFAEISTSLVAMSTWAGVLVWLAALSAIDLRTRRLPDRLTLPGAAAICSAAALSGPASLRAAIFGGVLLAGGYRLIRALAPEGLGGGDVKLALGIGAWLGPLGPAPLLTAAIGGFVVTAVAGLLLAAARRRRPWGQPVPHGPGMALAAVLVAVMAAGPSPSAAAGPSPPLTPTPAASPGGSSASPGES